MSREQACSLGLFKACTYSLRLSRLSFVGMVLSQVMNVPRPWYGSPGVLERWIDVAIPDAPRSEAVDTLPLGAQIDV